MSEHEGTAKKILKGIGKGLIKVGKVTGNAIKEDIRRGEEERRWRNQQEMRDRAIAHDTYVQGRAYGRGVQDGKYESIQRERDRQAYQRNLNNFGRSMTSDLSGFAKNAENFYTQDFPKKKKRVSYY